MSSPMKPASQYETNSFSPSPDGFIPCPNEIAKHPCPAAGFSPRSFLIPNVDTSDGLQGSVTSTIHALPRPARSRIPLGELESARSAYGRLAYTNVFARSARSPTSSSWKPRVQQPVSNTDSSFGVAGFVTSHSPRPRLPAAAGSIRELAQYCRPTAAMSWPVSGPYFSV